MKGKTALMAGAAAIALVVSGQAAEAKKHHHRAPPPEAGEPSSVSSSPSAPPPPSNAELAARVQALEDALEADESKQTADHTRLSTLEQGFTDVQWSFDNARPTVKTGDGRFTLAIRARFQADFAGFMNDAMHANGPPPASASWSGKGHLSSGGVIRRAYFGVEGRAFKDFWYELRFNAGGSDGGSNGATEGDPLLNKAVITYTGIPNFHVNVGVLEPNFMFEGTTSSAWLTFMERPEIDNIAADSYGAGDARRGVEVNWQKTDTLWAGDNLNITAAYTGGKTASSAGHGNSSGEQSQALARVSERVWSDGISNFQIGASAADILSTGGTGGSSVQLRDRPEIRVDGTRLIDTGTIASKHGYMYAFDAGMNFGSLFLGAEYAHFSVDRDPSGSHPKDHPDFSGWYVEGSYFLTGETRAYSASALNNEVGGWEGPSAVASPFSLDGDSWGAWEVAARYSVTDLDWHKNIWPSTVSGSPQPGIPGGRESVIDLGVNWYLNKDIRLMVDGLIVHLSKQGTPGVLGANVPGTAPGGTTVVHPQGQDFGVVGVRLQFAN